MSPIATGQHFSVGTAHQPLFCDQWPTATDIWTVDKTSKAE
jgi:hypothetical protein